MIPRLAPESKGEEKETETEVELKLLALSGMHFDELTQNCTWRRINPGCMRREKKWHTFFGIKDRPVNKDPRLVQSDILRRSVLLKKSAAIEVLPTRRIVFFEMDELLDTKKEYLTLDKNLAVKVTALKVKVYKNLEELENIAREIFHNLECMGLTKYIPAKRSSDLIIDATGNAFESLLTKQITAANFEEQYERLCVHIEELNSYFIKESTAVLNQDEEAICSRGLTPASRSP